MRRDEEGEEWLPCMESDEKLMRIWMSVDLSLCIIIMFIKEIINVPPKHNKEESLTSTII